MKKHIRRLLAALLSMTMVLLFIPIGLVVANAAAIGDDYPHKGVTSGYDNWRMVKSQCTSFAAWRLSSQNGYNIVHGGKDWTAKYWDDRAREMGIIVNSTPAIGSIAYWEAGVGGAGGTGHVAWVANISDNSIVIEEYNARFPTDVNPNAAGLCYNRRTLSSSNPSGYIHFKDISAPTTPPGKPSVSTNKSVYTPNEMINISWSAISNAAWYDFYIENDQGWSMWKGSDEIGLSTSQSYDWISQAGSYKVKVTAVNNNNGTLQFTDSDWCHFTVVPSFPTAPSGFTDVTSSFVNKKIILKSLANGKYVSATNDGSSPFLVANSSNPGGSWEELTVRPITNGDVYLVATANGRRVKTNGGSWLTASYANEGNVPLDACLRIYKNNSTNEYCFRVRSTGLYIFANINDYGGLVAQGPMPGGWEPFSIEVRPNYTTSSAIADGYYAIRHKGSGKYLHVQAISSDNGAKLELWQGAGTANSTYLFERKSDGAYVITAKHSNKQVEVQASMLINSTPVQQWTNVSGQNNARWYIINTGSGYYKLVNKHSSSCIDVKGNYSDNGTPIIQYVDNGGDAQRFELIRQDFAITYNANGGSGAPAAQTKWRDVSLALSSAKPTRSGYTFLGWSTSKTATSPTYLAGGNYTANAAATLYAVWKSDIPPVLPKIKFDFAENGGTSFYKRVVGNPEKLWDIFDDNPHPLEFEPGTFVMLEPESFGFPGGSVFVRRYQALKEGWNHIGWNTDPNAKTSLYSVTMKDNDVTLYAIFKKAVSSAFVDAAGSQTISGTLYNKEVSVAATPPAQRAYAGWTAVGWSAETEPGAGPAAAFSLTENAETFYGVYQRDITLTYNSDGGSAVASETKKQSVNSFDLNAPSSVEFTAAEAPSKQGYDFLAWVSSTGEVCSSGDVISVGSNTTMKAVWKEKLPATYLIRYDANGGLNAPMGHIKTEQQVAALSSDAPIRHGYVFLGWAADEAAAVAQYQPGEQYAQDADIVLYAVWKPITYSIKYNANGGTGTMANSAHTFDVEAALSANAFSITGDIFAGWAFDPAETEPAYADKASVMNLTIADGTVIELYAVWTKNAPATYTVTVTNGTGGGSFAAGAVVTISAGTPPAGQRFKNWTVNSGGVTLANVNSATTTFAMPAKAVSVTANFEAIPANTYAVTVNSGSTNKSTATAGETITLTANSAPSGKIFDKWTTSDGVSFANASSTTTTFTMPSKNVTVTATYREAGNTTPAKGIFGTNAKWYGAWWHYLLFFICFGWIWMWF